MLSDIESDEETEIQDLEQLAAVLESDNPTETESDPQCFLSVASTSSASSSVLQEYSKIETALALNKLTDEKMRRLEKILIARLRECREKLSEIQNLGTTIEKQDKQETFRYANCGKPYFKDKTNFPAPDNDDTILMAKSNMYDFSYVSSVPGWTVKDKSDFISLLLKMSQEIKKNELKSKIAQLRREIKLKDNELLQKKVEAVKKEMDAVNKKTLKDLALPIDQEYDWDTLANKLNRRHSAQEYRSLWKLFLHPSISKNSWSKHEHTSLQEIAYNNKLQDWDKIAKDLNTDRTGYQCFVYFRTNMSNTFTGQKWTKEEEEYLKRLIEYYKEDDYIPWGKVASSMGNRTKIQIYNKYSRLIEQRKGRFLPEEDAVILNCIENFGTNFKKMTKYLPGRSVIQIRTRYYVLAKKRISTVWTVEEDKQLIQLMANQDSATNFSSVTKYFPGKDRVHIRSRYVTLVKWMRRNPNIDIAKVPRRGARRLGHGNISDNLNKALEKLKTRIQTEVENRRCKRITRNSSEDVIEDAIIATLLNENVKEKARKKSTIHDEEQFVLKDNTVVTTQSLNVTNLRKILILLKARLKKDLFHESSYFEQYKGLLEPDQEVCLVKVKSYSKKDTVTTIKVNGTPDIWGNIGLGSLEYVLPPQYATITGCRKLMAYVSAKPSHDNPISLNIVTRRNVLLKDQLFNLMERFNSLFLWPMLLSNEGPNLSKKYALTSFPRFPPVLDHEKARNAITAVPIPDNLKNLDVVDEKIDLEESDHRDEVTVKEMRIGSEELFFLDCTKKKNYLYL